MVLMDEELAGLRTLGEKGLVTLPADELKAVKDAVAGQAPMKTDELS